MKHSLNLYTALIISIFCIGSSSGAFAAEPIYSCHSNKQRFEVYQTPAGYKGQLTDLYGGKSFNCGQPEKQGGNLQTLWSCTEDRAGEGLVQIRIEVSHVSGVTAAFVSQKPMSGTSAINPAPSPVVTFVCL